MVGIGGTVCHRSLLGGRQQQRRPVVGCRRLGEPADEREPSTHNILSHGHSGAYAPLVKKAFVGQSTGLPLQNLGSSPATVNVTSYARDGGAVYAGQPLSIAPGATQTAQGNRPPNAGLRP